MEPHEKEHTDRISALQKAQIDNDALVVARVKAHELIPTLTLDELNGLNEHGVPVVEVGDIPPQHPEVPSQKAALSECIATMDGWKTPILKGDVSAVADKLKMIRDIILMLALCVLTLPAIVRAAALEAEKEFDFKIQHVSVAKLNERGFNEVNPAFYRLTEKFLQRPALKAVNELPGSDSTSPTATALLAYTIANKNFSVGGTNMTTALCTFCTGTGLVPTGGITLNTAGADADQAIVWPSLSTGITQWSNGAWRSDRRTRFDSWVRTGGKPSAISNSVLSSNVVTITTSTNHNLSIGQTVNVAILTGPALFADMNGNFIVASIPSTTTFTYALTHANITTTASTGTLTTNADRFIPSYAINTSALTSNVVTITTANTINLVAGDRVTIALLTGPTSFADMNGTFTVASASTNSFTYALTHINIGSGASTGTATSSRQVPTCNVLLQTIWTGLKLTNTGVIATDDDQFYVRFLSSENSGQFQVITSRANVDTTSVIPVTVTPNTLYRFRFTIDAQLNPVFMLNGQAYDLGAAGNAPLTTGISFIPYVGTSANGTTPGTKAIDVLEESIMAVE